jgi:hypothetical protein
VRESCDDHPKEGLLLSHPLSSLTVPHESADLISAVKHVASYISRPADLHERRRACRADLAKADTMLRPPTQKVVRQMTPRVHSVTSTYSQSSAVTTYSLNTHTIGRHTATVQQTTPPGASCQLADPKRRLPLCSAVTTYSLKHSHKRPAHSNRPANRRLTLSRLNSYWLLTVEYGLLTVKPSVYRHSLVYARGPPTHRRPQRQKQHITPDHTEWNSRTAWIKSRSNILAE